MPAEATQRDASGKQQFNVYRPPGLVRELKHGAIEERSSLSGYVERLFRVLLARKREDESK